MREHFLLGNSCKFTEGFHLAPDLLSIHTFSPLIQKKFPAADSPLCSVSLEFPAKLVRNQNRAVLSFQQNLCPAAACRFHGDISDLTHPDSGGADGLHQQAQGFFSLPVGGFQQLIVIRSCQNLLICTKKTFLNANVFDVILLLA